MISQIAYNGFTFASTNADIESFTGNGFPDIRTAEQVKSQQDGAIATGYKYGARTFGFAGHLTSADDPLTAAAYLTERDELMAALNLQNQPVEGLPMTFTLITGGTRTLREVRLISAVLDFPAGEPSIVWNSYQLTFRATFPFFEGTAYDEDQEITDFSAGAAIPTPIPAALSGTSSASPYASYTNNGNANAYPVFTITGPGSGFTVLNRTNSQTFYIDYTLAAGETIEIDTWNHTVKLNGDSNLLYYFEGDFIHFEPGTTTVAFVADSGDTADTNLNVVYSDTYMNI